MEPVSGGPQKPPETPHHESKGWISSLTGIFVKSQMEGEQEVTEVSPENAVLPHEILQLILQQSDLNAMSIVSKHWNEGGAKYVKARLQEQYNHLIKSLDQEKYAALITPIFDEQSNFSAIKTQLMERMTQLFDNIEPDDLIALKNKNPQLNQMINSVAVNKKLNLFISHPYYNSMNYLYLTIKNIAFEKFGHPKIVEPISSDDHFIEILQLLPDTSTLNNSLDIASVMTAEVLKKILPFVHAKSSTELIESIAFKCSSKETFNELLKLIDKLPVKKQLGIIDLMVKKGTLEGKLLDKTKKLLVSPECVLRDGHEYLPHWLFAIEAAKKADKELLILILNRISEVINQYPQQPLNDDSNLIELFEVMFTSPSFDDEIFNRIMLEMQKASEIIPNELRHILDCMIQDLEFPNESSKEQLEGLLDSLGDES